MAKPAAFIYSVEVLNKTISCFTVGWSTVSFKSTYLQLNICDSSQVTNTYHNMQKYGKLLQNQVARLKSFAHHDRNTRDIGRADYCPRAIQQLAIKATLCYTPNTMQCPSIASYSAAILGLHVGRTEYTIAYCDAEAVRAGMDGWTRKQRSGPRMLPRL